MLLEIIIIYFAIGFITTWITFMMTNLDFPETYFLVSFFFWPFWILLGIWLAIKEMWRIFNKC